MTIPRLFVFVLSAWLLMGCQSPQVPPPESVKTSPSPKTVACTRTRSFDWSLPPDNPEGITEQKLASQTADSLSRQWKNAHEYTGLPCPGCEEDLSVFFDHLGAWQAGLPDAPEPATLLAAAETLRAAPCDDPALLHGHGLLLQDAGRYPEAFDLFLQAAARYDQLGASGILKARNAVAVYVVIHQIGDDHDKDQCFRWKDRALEFLAQGIARDTFRPEDLRPLHAHIRAHWKKIYWTRDGDQRHIVSRRIEELGGGEPWLVRMLRGHHEYRRAWADRGGGFANTVTPEGWKGFADHYARAEADFREALALHPDFPEPIDFLIDIAAAGHNSGSETDYDWFRLAVEAQIDYWPAYKSFVFHTLPRWGGTPEQLAHILNMISENERFDTRLPRYALYHYRTIASDRTTYPGPWTRRGITLHPWRDPDGWAIFRRVYEGYLRHPGPIPFDRSELLMDYLNDAHQFDQPAEFLRILDEHAGSAGLDPAAFEQTHGYPLPLAEARARLQTDNPAFSQLLVALDRRNFTEAQRLLDRLEADGADPAVLAPLRRTRRVRAELEPENDWIETPAYPTVRPWTVHRGTCHPAFDGAYLGQSQDQRNLILLGQTTNGNWEIAADAVIVANTTDGEANAALFVAKDKSTFVSFALYPGRGEAVLARGSQDARRAPVSVEPSPNRNRLRLRVDNNRFSAWVNGQPVFSGESIEDFTWAHAFRLGFGGLYPTAGATVRFENVRFRPLPPPVSSEEVP